MLNHVFRPLAIAGLTVPHRIVMGAMHLNLETLDDDGAALAAFYAERVRGGAGLVVTGGSAVNPAGSGGPGYGVLDDERHRSALRRAVDAVHDAGGLIALQLFHAGRYAPAGPDGGEPLAPSAVYSRFSRTAPRAMTEEEVAGTVAAFGRGARAACALGFDAVEVMGSEGYLINQFTAPLTNLRDDAWGGDPVRRRRFPIEVLRAVRASVEPAFPVLFRMSGADLIEDGTPWQETAALAVELAAAGADALAVGIGWHESPVPTVQSQVPAGTWAGYAQRVKRALRAAGHGTVPVIASNRFNRLTQAEDVLAGGDVDLVAMARPFLADPAIIDKSRTGADASVDLCIACNEACIDRSFGTERVSCLVNPRAGHERDFPARPSAGRRGRYAVIGAGLAGLEAARTLARLGYKVEVYEEADEPGGQFRLAARVPGKADFAATVRQREEELAGLGVPVYLGHRVGARDVPLLRAMDGVVLATGVRPHRPELPGADLPHVLDYARALADPDALGPRVVVIGGGGIAVDLAHLLAGGLPAPTAEEFLASRALTAPSGSVTASARAAVRQVTVMRRGGRIGTGIGPSTRWVVMAELRACGVRLLTGVAYREITPEGVVVEAEGGTTLVGADHVVLATGQESRQEVAAVLREAGVPFEIAGGAADARALNAVRATAQGLRAAHRVVERAGALGTGKQRRPGRGG
ncbi:NADPH-dependent 2,4-dienoyl-CoA reductase [Streptomyces marokkonensis]|uniref:NADPH-dependent 2,4-dienoyl-CoA reductase n=1 Tax=Streptomyces marokkonensis TaxID=324855 RepID=A0ABP7SE36_9ACTN